MLLSGKFVVFPFIYEQDCSNIKIVTFGYIGESPENFMSKYTQEV